MNIEQLPREILMQVAEYLSETDRSQLERVSKLFKRLMLNVYIKSVLGRGESTETSRWEMNARQQVQQQQIHQVQQVQQEVEPLLQHAQILGPEQSG